MMVARLGLLLLELNKAKRMTNPMASEARLITAVISSMSRDWPMSGQMRERTLCQTAPGVAMRPSTERETATMSRPVRIVVARARSRKSMS